MDIANRLELKIIKALGRLWVRASRVCWWRGKVAGAICVILTRVVAIAAIFLTRILKALRVVVSFVVRLILGLFLAIVRLIKIGGRSLLDGESCGLSRAHRATCASLLGGAGGSGFGKLCEFRFPHSLGGAGGAVVACHSSGLRSLGGASSSSTGSLSGGCLGSLGSLGLLLGLRDLREQCLLRSFSHLGRPQSTSGLLCGSPCIKVGLPGLGSSSSLLGLSLLSGLSSLFRTDGTSGLGSTGGLLSCDAYLSLGCLLGSLSGTGSLHRLGGAGSLLLRSLGSLSGNACSIPGGIRQASRCWSRRVRWHG